MSMETNGDSLIYNLSSNSSGDIAGAGCENGNIVIYRAEEGEIHPMQTLKFHKSAVFDLLFIEDGLISCAYDGTIGIWSCEGNSYVFNSSISLFQGAINSIAYSDGSIICGCSDGKIRVVDKGGKIVHETTAHRYGVTAVSASNGIIASSGMDGSVKVWKSDLTMEMEIKEHSAPVRDCKISVNPFSALVFASCSDDGTTVIYTKKDPAQKTPAIRIVKKEDGTKEKIAIKEVGNLSGDLLFTVDKHVTEKKGCKLSWSKSGYALAVGLEDGESRVFVPSGVGIWDEASVVMP